MIGREDSSIDRLQKKLYAREGAPGERGRRTLSNDHEEEVAEGWARQEDIRPSEDTLSYNPERELELLRQGVVRGEDGEGETVPSVFHDERARPEAAQSRAKRRVMMRLVKTIFYASFVFFLIASGIAGYLYWAEYNQVACDRIPIEVTGLTSVPGGTEYLFNVSIENNNPVALTDTTLFFEYPEGSRNPDNTAVPLTEVRESIGTIESNEPVRSVGRVVLYGREQTDQVIGLAVEYRIKDSNALFTCRREHLVRLATAPVSLKVDGIQEIASGQELVLTVTVGSNADQVVPNQRVVVEYPFGYQFVRAEPAPSHDTNVWDVGDVGQGHERTIIIRGHVQAQSTEARSIRVTLGEGDATDPSYIQNALQFIEHPLTITRPFLALELALNGDVNPVVSAQLGKTVSGHLRYTNTLPDAIFNVEVEAVLPGTYVNRSKVTVQNGFFRSVDQTILWAPSTYTKLREIGPGETGTLSFSFETRSPVDVPVLLSPSMDISFAVRGQRVRDNVPVQQTLLSQAQRTIRFVTTMAFTPSVAYSVGPFQNTGPFPPKVDTETTYTVLWRLDNSVNDITDAGVRGTLPVYVSWEDKIHPEGENITYNPLTREVTWVAGTLPAHAGSVGAPREVSFQIALIPSITQLDLEVVLVRDVSARGVDSFTGIVIERPGREQTTTLSYTADPLFNRDRGVVVP